MTAPNRLHQQILNLPCDSTSFAHYSPSIRQLYEIGHRDAKRAAAELVLTELAAAPRDTASADRLTFAAVNEYVHDVGRSYDDMQGLCLDLAKALEDAGAAAPRWRDRPTEKGTWLMRHPVICPLGQIGIVTHPHGDEGEWQFYGPLPSPPEGA